MGSLRPFLNFRLSKTPAKPTKFEEEDSMAYMRLGDLLITAGAITPEQLDRAL